MTFPPWTTWSWSSTAPWRSANGCLTRLHLIVASPHGRWAVWADGWARTFCDNVCLQISSVCPVCPVPQAILVLNLIVSQVLERHRVNRAATGEVHSARSYGTFVSTAILPAALWKFKRCSMPHGEDSGEIRPVQSTYQISEEQVCWSWELGFEVRLHGCSACVGTMEIFWDLLRWLAVVASKEPTWSKWHVGKIRSWISGMHRQAKNAWKGQAWIWHRFILPGICARGTDRSHVFQRYEHAANTEAQFLARHLALKETEFFSHVDYTLKMNMYDFPPSSEAPNCCIVLVTLSIVINSKINTHALSWFPWASLMFLVLLKSSSPQLSLTIWFFSDHLIATVI